MRRLESWVPMAEKRTRFRFSEQGFQVIGLPRFNVLMDVASHWLTIQPQNPITHP
jgi:hypothetical protein